MSRATQELKQTLKRQLISDEKFTDSQFPPQPATVLGPNYSKYHLHRASDLYDQLHIMPAKINSSDIQPGFAKNGTFLSAVATLAQDQSAIQRLFLTEEPNKVGLYAIWLCKNGTWTPVTIDDYLPCKMRSGAYFPLFSQSSNEEIWISLLEKAYAKIYGSYANTEKGSCALALRDLTGAPVEELNEHSDAEKIWKTISQAIEKQYLLCCSTETIQEDSQAEYETPDNTHAQIILDAREVETEKGLQKLILIKNPWGETQWKGDWSHESKLWTENLRDKLNYHENDARSGLFWISLEDFERHFARTWVCKYNPTNKYYSVNFSDNHRSSEHVLRINVPVGQEVTISINQKDARCFEGQQEDYEYSYGRLLLAKIYNDKGLGYLTGDAGEKRNLEITKTLSTGTYILTAEVNWNQSYNREFNISFYSEGELEIEAVPDADILAIQKSIILSSTDSSDNIHARRPYDKYGDSGIEKYEGNIHGLLFFYYNNESKKGNKLVEKIKFSKLENMHVSEENPSKEVEVNVVPGREALVLYKAFASDYIWSYTTTFNVQPLADDEDAETFEQEPYDYIDDFNRWAPVDVNNDYNLYIKERLEKEPKKRQQEEEEEDEEEEEVEVKTLSRVLDETFPEERKSADSWTRSKGHESFLASPTLSPNKTAKRYPAIDMEIGQTNLKKIPYFNYDSYDKIISIVSSDPRTVQVRTPTLKVKAGETVNIKLRLYAPNEVGSFRTELEVRGKNARLEERLVISINNRDSSW